MAFWPEAGGDSVPGMAMTFMYECRHCQQTMHDVWMETAPGYRKAVEEGRYPKESPVKLKRMTKAELKALEEKQERVRERREA